MVVKVRSERLGGSHCVARVRGEGGLDPVGTAVERERSGKEEECGDFLEAELTELAEGLNLGVKGRQRPRTALWFLACATGRIPALYIEEGCLLEREQIWGKDLEIYFGHISPRYLVTSHELLISGNKF